MDIVDEFMMMALNLGGVFEDIVSFFEVTSCMIIIYWIL